MFWMGDEVRRSQDGNNNAYCQDSELGWFNWELVEKNKDLYHFVQQVIAFKNQPNNLWNDFKDHGYYEYLEWHGVELNKPDLSENSHTLSYSFTSKDDQHRFQFISNAYWEALDFELTEPLGDDWEIVINTANKYPYDCYHNVDREFINNQKLRVEPRSIVILHSKL